VRLTEGRAEEDTFRVHDNVSSKRRIRRLAAAAGFEIERLDDLDR
jgi:hypothetical protein